MTDKIEYDNDGRMKYHPDFHPNTGKKWTESDLEYLCKYHEVDEIATLSFALGRTVGVVTNKIAALKKQGLYDYYKNRGKYW